MKLSKIKNKMNKRGILLLIFIFAILILAVSLIAVSNSEVNFNNSNNNINEAGELKVTPDHPFLVDGEWIEAKDLKIGDLLKTIDGRKAKIMSIEHVVLEEPVAFYNLEADPYENFIVSDGIVVHNSNVPKPRVRGITAEEYMAWWESVEYQKLVEWFEFQQRLPTNSRHLKLVFKRSSEVKNPEFLRLGAKTSDIYELINTQTNERIATFHSIKRGCRPLHQHIEPEIRTISGEKIIILTEEDMIKFLKPFFN